MATAESVKAKIQGLINTANETTGGADTDLTSAVNTLAAGFGQGGESSGGISAVKFIDVDVTVEASTTTAVTYTVEDLELIAHTGHTASVYGAFTRNENYVAFVTPKDVADASGNTTAVYNKGMAIVNGVGNYAKTQTNIISWGSSGLGAQNQGIYGIALTCTSYNSGKYIGKMDLSVKHNTAGSYEVRAGTYNIEVWYLADYDWGL